MVRNGFLSVRVWFPAARGVLTSSDQEVIIMMIIIMTIMIMIMTIMIMMKVIIMCKPPGGDQASVTSTQPPVTSEGLKVEGEIEEQQLRYEVSLYRQAEEDEDGDDVRGVVR